MAARAAVGPPGGGGRKAARAGRGGALGVSAQPRRARVTGCGRSRSRSRSCPGATGPAASPRPAPRRSWGRSARAPSSTSRTRDLEGATQREERWARGRLGSAQGRAGADGGAGSGQNRKTRCLLLLDELLSPSGPTLPSGASWQGPESQVHFPRVSGSSHAPPASEADAGGRRARGLFLFYDTRFRHAEASRTLLHTLFG